MITIEPLGGLGNRMRVIASCLWLAYETNHELEIIWEENWELNCSFDKLFETIPNVRFVSKGKKELFAHRSNQSSFFKKSKAYFRNKLLNIDYCIKEIDMKNVEFRNQLQVICQKNKNLYISTCQEFGDHNKYYEVFKPVESIQKRVDEKTASFSEHTIGIHIRRTDNLIAKEKSPVSLFQSKMEENIAKNKEASFFLATDDKDVEEELKVTFGKRIITNQKIIDRNIEQGIIDAVIDMFCLSKAKCIYGSYYSSFSEIAATIGVIELLVIKKTA